MERRAHWSDDLIDAVRDAVDVEFDDIWKLSEDSILAVIAAVEDWRNSNIQVHWQGMTATERNLSEALGREQHGRDELEAAIKRVRGIVDADQTVPIDARDPASYVAGYADATFRVRQVLDGGQR